MRAPTGAIDAAMGAVFLHSPMLVQAFGPCHAGTLGIRNFSLLRHVQYSSAPIGRLCVAKTADRSAFCHVQQFCGRWRL